MATDGAASSGEEMKRGLTPTSVVRKGGSFL